MPRPSKKTRSSAGRRTSAATANEQLRTRNAQEPVKGGAAISRAKTGKPSSSRSSIPTNPAVPQPRNNKRRRADDDDEDELAAEEAGSSKQASQPHKKVAKTDETRKEKIVHRRSRVEVQPTVDEESEEDENEVSPDEDDFSVPVLKARTRKIAFSTMNSKWGNLSESQQRDALSVMQSAARPVLMAFRNDRARADAQKVLTQIYEKMERRLTRYLAPPCKDIAFNLDKLHDENRKLEALLEPGTRQIGELQSTIESELLALERDKQQLEILKKNARDEEITRNKQARSVHRALKKFAKDENRGGNETLRIYEEPASTSSNTPFNIADDKKFLSTVKTLQNHLVSMQSNRAALGVIPETMQVTRAMVDDVVHRKTNKYDEMKGLCLAPIVKQSEVA